MALTGKFDADFESFHREVVKADGHLKTLQTTSTQTAKSFDQLSTTGGGAFRTFEQGLSQADKTLATFGVHLGPQIQAIREIGEASGKTATQIGLIGTASLAAAAAMGGWQVGRMVADFFGLDEAIAQTTATLLNWGNVAAETAAAKADTIATAIKRGAVETISYTEAIKYNEEWLKTHGNAMDTSRERVSAWQAEIRKLRASGDLPALQKEMESGNSTAAQMATEFKISAEAIGYLQRQTRAQVAAQKDLDAAFAATQKLAGSFIGQEAITKAGQYLQALNALKAQGVEPLKSSIGDITTVLGNAIRAFEETGRTGEAMYGTLVAAQRQLLGLTQEGLLQSRNLAVGVAEVPRIAVDAWTKGALDIAYANQQAAQDSTAWWEQYRKDQDEIITAAEARIEEMADKVPKTHGEMVDKMRGQLREVGEEAKKTKEIVVTSWQQGMDLARQGLGTMGGVVQQGGPFRATREQIQRAHETGRYYGPVTQSGQPDYVKLGYDKVEVNIDARDSFYDSNAGVQKLADKVGAALMAKLRSQGVRA